MAAPLATDLTVADLDRYDENEHGRAPFVEPDVYVSERDFVIPTWCAAQVRVQADLTRG